MSASNRRTSSTADRCPPAMPASPVILVAAALAQRLITSGRRRRRERLRAERAASGQQDQPAPAGAEHEDAAVATAGDTACGKERCRRCCSVPRRILSVGVAGASVAVMLGAAAEMTAARTTLDPHAPQETTQLVTTGPFAYSRNPLYLAGAGLLWAHALWLGSPRALLPVGGFVLALDKCQIPLEEAALEQKFGKKYRTYAQQVPRWLVR